MKKYILKKFGNENTLYEGYLTGYVLEMYGKKTAITKIIDNFSSFRANAGDTRLIYCGEESCEYFETEEECRQRLKEVMKYGS